VTPAPDNSEDLRQWRLPRGRHGLPRELVARSQRERLLAAVVRVTAAEGYEAMSVADILDQAGVGRQSFYELFADKLDCLLAAYDFLIDDLAATTAVEFEKPGPWPERARSALAVVLGWLAFNPDAARVALIEIGAVGPIARSRFRVVLHRFATMLNEGLEEPDAASDLPNITSLAAGTVLARIHEEAVKGRTAELPALLPELTFELLVPFVGEEAARTTARNGDG
jgi:AcrR family transcriptional regulator